MKLAEVESTKLRATLNSLSRAIEEILRSGLTAASETTRQTLEVSFQEASRMRLLRLGTTLRVANEELARFTRNEPEFSPARLSFFLSRAWLLCRGLARAIDTSDEGLLSRMLQVPATRPVACIEAVALGTTKKVVKNAFCAFDFRLRTTVESSALPVGQSLVWSFIFPLKPGAEIPPEGLLHLPQKQKFKPHVLLTGKTIRVEHAFVAMDERGQGRLTLNEESSVTVGEEFGDWAPLFTWDAARSLEHLDGYVPGPFDLEIELQEEVVLDEWEFVRIGSGGWQSRSRDGQEHVRISCRNVPFELAISEAADGDALRAALAQLLTKRRRPPLYGIMHYAGCRLVVQPVSLLETKGPRYITISDKHIDRQALLRALKF